MGVAKRISIMIAPTGHTHFHVYVQEDQRRVLSVETKHIMNKLK